MSYEKYHESDLNYVILWDYEAARLAASSVF